MLPALIVPNMNALQYLSSLAHAGNGGFWSTQNPEKGWTSGSELRRWIQQSAFHINGEAVQTDTMLDYPVWSVALFPKNDKKRITIF